jgi:hypothetical protein
LTYSFTAGDSFVAKGDCSLAEATNRKTVVTIPKEINAFQGLFAMVFLQREDCRSNSIEY